MKLRNSYTAQLLSVIVIIVMIVFASCRKEDAINTDASLKLNFSADSVIFDTVFTSIGSATKQLMIYNRTSSKLLISNISLGNGEQSAYRINVDGKSGSSFSDIELSGGDSLYVFVRVTIDPQDINNPYVVDDEIYFSTNGNDQSVKLVAWGQDANYILADTYVDGLPPYKIVADSLQTVHWTSEKPYVIYGYAVINSYGKLIIDEGTHVYLHKGSGIWAYVDGELNVLGTDENKVTFSGDRLEKQYENLPGQWDRIWLMESREGHDHIIRNAVISNAFIGLQTESFTRITENKVKLHNVIIENMTGIGIFSRIFNIQAENVLISDCGAYNIAITGGGDYDFIQSTVAAYWKYAVRNTPAVFINNYFLDTLDNPISFPINFRFDNSIIYGYNTNEFETDMDGGADSLYYFTNSLIKTTYNISNEEFFVNVLNNQDPLFVDVNSYDYRIDSLSPAIGRADEAIASAVQRDLLNNPRMPLPDIGAYQFMPGQQTSQRYSFPSNMMFNRRKLNNIKRIGNYPPIKSL